MARPMDALASFTHLAENIPEWLSKLDDLAAQVADQHARFARVSHSHFTQYRLSKKHDSTESLRPSREDLDDPGPAPIPLTDPSAPPLEIPPTSRPSTTPLAREIQRKRKPASNLSVSSGPQKYRTRTMVIVYYNSAIQAAFEDLVRCIAAARNNLRKGKTAASLKARMLSIGMGNDDDDDAYPFLNPKMMIKRVPRSSSPPDVGPRCDQADGDLEAAQNLCEVAAHQFLRDGDCEDELEGTRKRFEDCLKVAKEGVEKLKAEKEGDGPADASEPTVDAATPTPIRTESVPIATQKLDVPRIPVVPTLTANGTIEVDDESDASSVHIDLTAFRRTRRV